MKRRRHEDRVAAVNARLRERRSPLIFGPARVFTEVHLTEADHLGISSDGVHGYREVGELVSADIRVGEQ